MRTIIYDCSPDCTGTKVKCNYLICVGQMFGLGQLEDKNKLEKIYRILKYYKKTSTAFLRFNLFTDTILVAGNGLVAKIILSKEKAVTIKIKNAFLSTRTNRLVVDDEVAKTIKSVLIKNKILFRTSAFKNGNSVFLNKNLKIVIYEE